ncbi:MAG: hypothetical protein MRY74_04800 [Neomegalonema sp.]|nr:hypothetical protein [Neomegalonema sp.]
MMDRLSAYMAAASGRLRISQMLAGAAMRKTNEGMDLLFVDGRREGGL